MWLAARKKFSSSADKGSPPVGKSVRIQTKTKSVSKGNLVPLHRVLPSHILSTLARCFTTNSGGLGHISSSKPLITSWLKALWSWLLVKNYAESCPLCISKTLLDKTLGGGNQTTFVTDAQHLLPFGFIHVDIFAKLKRIYASANTARSLPACHNEINTCIWRVNIKRTTQKTLKNA